MLRKKPKRKRKSENALNRQTIPLQISKERLLQSLWILLKAVETNVKPAMQSVNNVARNAKPVVKPALNNAKPGRTNKVHPPKNRHVINSFYISASPSPQP